MGTCIRYKSIQMVEIDSEHLVGTDLSKAGSNPRQRRRRRRRRRHKA
jgi:hypothetical protein